MSTRAKRWYSQNIDTMSWAKIRAPSLEIRVLGLVRGLALGLVRSYPRSELSPRSGFYRVRVRRTSTSAGARTGTNTSTRTSPETCADAIPRHVFG